MDSKLFGEADGEIIRILEMENSTINFHQYCITEEVSDDVTSGLSSEYLNALHADANVECVLVIYLQPTCIKSGLPWNCGDLESFPECGEKKKKI